jgi:hypothetical protein
LEVEYIWGEEENTHRALAIVAIEIPVDPTVPSKIREPVYGCKSPSRSASSITLRANSQKEGFVKYHIEHTSKCDTVLYAAPRVEILQNVLILRDNTVATYSYFSGHAHLRLAKNLDAQCIAERVNPDQRCVSYTVYADSSVSPRTRAPVDDGHAPINPVTPSSISSLRNSMGRRLALVIALSSVRLLYVETTEVVAKEREKPMRMP